MVGSTDALAIVPEGMYRYFAKFQAMAKVDVKLQAPVETYGLIHIGNRQLPPAARALYDFIIESANNSRDMARTPRAGGTEPAQIEGPH